MPEPDIASLGLFSGEEHQPFYWDNGPGAVLLVHGFMGTPAEMRPLAQKLYQAGWTVQGLLLPGFGPQIDTLFDRNYHEWLAATRQAMDELQKKHQPLLLVGYSMGAAAVINVAVDSPPEKLILLAPFTRIGNTFHAIIWQLVKRLFPNPQPFKKANFSDPRIRQFFGGMVPELKLDDPKVQEILRQLRVPASFVDQLLVFGRISEKSAVQIQSPTLIVQGSQDETIKPSRTRQLARLFPGTVKYLEIEADHGIVEINQPNFRQVTDAILNFSSSPVPEITNR